MAAASFARKVLGLFAECVAARAQRAAQPATLRRLFEGRNEGKQLLRVAE